MNLSVVAAMLGGFRPREVGEDGRIGSAEGRRIYREGGVEAGPKLRLDPSAHCHTERNFARLCVDGVCLDLQRSGLALGMGLCALR